jgi:serine phosphatase RsbU (regulator of sigma subunit)
VTRIIPKIKVLRQEAQFHTFKLKQLCLAQQRTAAAAIIIHHYYQQQQQQFEQQFAVASAIAANRS